LKLKLQDVIEKQTKNVIQWVIKMLYLTESSQVNKIPITYVKNTDEEIIFSYRFYSLENTFNRVELI